MADLSNDDLARAAVGGDPAALEAYLTMLKNRNTARGVHLGTHLGIETLEVVTDRVSMRMPWRRELRRWGGIFHGGAIMALADQVAGCLFNTDPRISVDECTGVTTDFSVSFLRAAAQDEAIVATGTVLRRGRKVTFMQIDVRAEVSAVVVATCRATYLTVPRASVTGVSYDRPHG